jgi:hypothetical protein
MLPPGEIHAPASTIPIVTINFRMRQCFWPLEVVRTLGFVQAPSPLVRTSSAPKAGRRGQVFGAGSPSGLAGKLLAARYPRRAGYVTARSRPAGGQNIETCTAAPQHDVAYCLVLRLAACCRLHCDAGAKSGFLPTQLRSRRGWTCALRSASRSLLRGIRNVWRRNVWKHAALSRTATDRAAAVWFWIFADRRRLRRDHATATSSRSGTARAGR